MNSKYLKGFIKKLTFPVFVMAGILGISQTLHATTVDVPAIAEDMCHDLIPGNSNTSSSNACVAALDKCRQDLTGHLVATIDVYNEWASLWNKPLIQLKSGGGFSYTMASEVYDEVIQDYFITQHKRAKIVLGGNYGNTKILTFVSFQGPSFSTISNDVKTDCKKIPYVFTKTYDLFPQNQGGNDPVPDPVQDPVNDPANDPQNGGGNASNPPSVPTTASVGSQAQAAPLSTTNVANNTAGGGCSMVAVSSAGALGNLLLVIPSLFAVIFRKRKK